MSHTFGWTRRRQGFIAVFCSLSGVVYTPQRNGNAQLPSKFVGRTKEGAHISRPHAIAKANGAQTSARSRRWLLRSVPIRFIQHIASEYGERCIQTGRRTKAGRNFERGRRFGRARWPNPAETLLFLHHLQIISTYKVIITSSGLSETT